MKKILIIFLLPAIFMLTGYTELEPWDYRVRTVVVDAGHGGKDPGTHGQIAEEKDIALDVALKVGRKLEKIPGVKVLYTRDDNTFVELYDRASFANKNKADLFISIHCNAITRPEIHGTETYVMGVSKSQDNLNVAKRENAVVLMEENYKDNYNGYDPNSPISHILFANYQNAYLQNSMKFAYNVEQHFKNKLNKHSRGVKQEGFLVLWKTSMPSALIEIGYLTNKEEEKKLLNSNHQDEIANSITKAFIDYKQDIESED